jgi:DNA modification methylase
MTVRSIIGDCRQVLPTLPADSVHCCVTSPPYWGLRDYGVAGQIGMESTFEAFIAEMVAVFREVRRVLRRDGTLWLNLGDSYAAGKIGRADGFRNNIDGFTGGQKFKGETFRQRAVSDGLKPKDLCGIPWRVAFALQADGWWLRQDIIWSKPNPMPESVTDRCTKAHEYVFLLTKGERYYYDAQAIKEEAVLGFRVSEGGFRGGGSYTDHGSFDNGNVNPAKGHRGYDKSVGRNKRSVWEIATAPFPQAHFATFPLALVEPCILAGCPKGGTVLDPFGGAGTTGLVADRLQRDAILIELNPDYAKMGERRVFDDAPLLGWLGTQI